ncbi:MAG TPA: family 1 glycosylhydrolase [Vicinamibacteria bacterium]|nr:family 1 glycosylhydrolase [Vicinamibacteria bacterium]
MKRLLRVLGWTLGVLVVAWLGTCAYLSASHPRVEFTAAELARPAVPLPKGFLWGTATSSHQFEGGNTNDWTRFEAQPGAIERGETSAVSADHWNRMAEDVALMKAIHANAYRFSIEWSRLEPQEGTWNEEAFSRYGDLVRQLREAGITPAVTLLHFTLPLWMADRGGVCAPDFPNRFARFATEAGRRFGADVQLWITLNEPNVQMYLGYVLGDWPPQKKSPAEAVRAFVGLLRGHAAAAKALRAACPGARIGVANNVMLLEPRSRLMLSDWLGAAFVDQFWNWAFADAVRDGRARLRLPGATLDEPVDGLPGSVAFFGLNYYFRYFVRMAPWTPETFVLTPGPGLRSELGGTSPVGDSPPEALFLLMRKAWTGYHLPIYITEGGIADDKGTTRGPLIRGQVEAIRRARAEGIPVEGYFHWTLVDNFEWEKGYRPRFGLYRLDRETLARTPAGGADVFAALAPPR